MTEIAIAIVGSGGAGVVTVGQLLLKLAGQQGAYGILRKSYGPQIRGGESAALLRLADHSIAAPPDAFDLVVALDWRNAQRFVDEIPTVAQSAIVADEKAGDTPEFLTHLNSNITLPATSAVKALPGGRPNMWMLGWLARQLGFSEQAVADVLQGHFAAKGEAAITAALQSARLGIEHEQEMAHDWSLASAKTGNRWLLSGNEACGFGALKAGVRFVAAYPITPASDMLEYLAPRIEQLGGVLLQAEDELASINAIIGASWGGTPALTATSGPGLALMTEALGLAVASETPLVVVDVQRGGPSTGIPTKSEQTDLNIALHGLHGEAPHLVLAPLSIADAAWTTQWSVQLAEALQAPAIVLSDQFLGQTTAIVDAPALPVAGASRQRASGDLSAGYQRYAITEDGISPMAIPGDRGGMYTADGLEHEPGGKPSSAHQDHLAQMQKRRDKLTRHDYGDQAVLKRGDGGLAFLTFGSSFAVCEEAQQRLNHQGIATRLVAPRLLAPLPVEDIEKALAGCSQVMVVEHNLSAQFYQYLCSQIPGFSAVSYAQPGPVPLRVAEIVAFAQSLKEAA